MTRVVSVALSNELGQRLLELTPEGSSVFIRGDQGLIGWGESWRFEAKGANRIEMLADAWREHVSTLEIEDSVDLPGTGPVAFGTITFADESAAASALVMPKVVIGRRDDRYWITAVDAAELPSVTEWSENSKIQLTPGEVAREEFSQLVDHAVSLIRRGDLDKVVLARDLNGELPEKFDNLISFLIAIIDCILPK